MASQPLSGPTADLYQGPFNELVTTLWQWLADNLPRDLTWPVLSVTLLIATAIWLLRDGRGAKAADGRESARPACFNFSCPGIFSPTRPRG